MKSLRPFALAGTLMLMSACTVFYSNTLELVSPPPKGVVPNTGVLEFQFSRAVVPPESTVIWKTTPYVMFYPPIEGKFVWQDSARVVFSPDAALPGDARFSGKLNVSLLLQLSGAKAFKGDEDFSFSTEPFMMSKAEFFYDRIDNDRQVGIKANLEFTYSVDPTDVAKYLKITIDGQPHQSFSMVTSVPSKVIPVEIGSLTQFERVRTIALSVDEQLTSPDTRTHIKFREPFVYNLPGLEELKIYGHEFGFDGTESWIRVKTSQEIDLKTVKWHIELNPSKDYRVERVDGPGFTMRGKFEPGSQFRLLIKKGMESVLGAKTQNDYEADIIIGNVKPSFRFVSTSGVYMLLGGARTVEVKTVNLPKLFVRVSQIFQNNLVFFLDGGRSYDYYYEYDEEDGWSSYSRKYRYMLGNYGRTLDQQTINITSSPNQEVSTFLDLTPYLRSDYKGFYLIEIADPAQSWRSTAKLVSISDLGLIVKKGKNEVNVFAVSLKTNAPLGGVKVNLISTNNQTIGTKQTDADGLARFSNFTDATKGFYLKLVTAELGEDFNFIHLSDYQVETSRFEVEGKRDLQGLYDAFLYGDRNIYRPGETVRVAGVVRTLRNEPPSALPVRIKIYHPSGTMISEQQRTLNDQGSFEITHETLFSSQTGEYRFDLFTGNELYLTSYIVSVEDFVPDRLRLELTPSVQSARPGDKVMYDLQAFNFFGPPAAGRNWEFEGTLNTLPYISKRFPEFRFADDAVGEYKVNPVVTNGKTNSEGKAEMEFTVPKDAGSQGVLRARARVAVFDESGRPVYQIANTTVFPKEYYIGVRTAGIYYVTPNDPQTVQIVAVDPNDSAIEGFKVKIELIRKEWQAVLRMHDQTRTLRYVSEERLIPVQANELTLSDGPAEYTYSVPRSGSYVLRVSKFGDTGYNQTTFYAYSWGTSDLTSFQINPEARIDIVLDKESYAPGDKARVLFRCPFSGKMLVTVERNKVLSYRFLNVEKNSASMEVEVTDEFLPNVYIAAVLFRKVKDLNIPLMAGHGFAPLPAERASNKLEVSINAPEKMRPKRKQTVTVSIPEKKSIYITLAAVDEGILQLKNYKTPDPYGYFYAKKALEVETYDFFRDLIPEPERKKSSTGSPGGGEDLERSLRMSPLQVQRFKPVSLWSGLVRTNEQGKAEVTLDVPEFSGELRLMAVAFDGPRFGSAQRAMKVADPVVITPGLPRFISPNDVITSAITAFNTTDKPVSLKLKIETEGPLTTAQSTAALELKPNQERSVDVILKATEQIGKAVVKVKTTAFGEDLVSVTELPVRPISPYVSEGFTGFVDGGHSVTHPIPDVFLEYGRRGHVFLSPFPVANFAKQLKHLVGYPHGCIEQTTSKAFPQIYLRDIALLLDPSILEKGSPTYFVNEAITKLTSMQLHDGTFAYWPGGSSSNAWSTVYATHFLTEAKRAGYAVPETMLKSALNAVTQITRAKTTTDYYSTVNNRTVIKRIADKSSIYGLYVLAAAGQPDVSLMNFYRTARNLLTLDTEYLLAGAFALSGDRKSYVELLPKQFSPEDAKRTTGGYYDSPIRANAIILNVLLETDPNNPNIGRYMEYLSDLYRREYWFSTQDNAFTLLGFGKAARLVGKASMEGIITIGGKQLSYKGGNKKYDITSFDGSVSIAMSGDGRVYYSIVTEGIRTDGKVRLENKNLRITREFFDRNGAPVNLLELRQNALVIIKLTLNSDVGGLENIAISDLLPGCFEIENPRVTDASHYSFIRNATTPLYVDIRDDRINLYTNISLHDRQQVFYYIVRAVTRGEFQYPPVVAETMYDGNYYSASGLGKVKVGD